MSDRSKIVDALVSKLREIDGTGTFNSNVFNNVFNILKFWDEVTDFPYISVTAGQEQRQYFPASFKWAFLDITLRIYVQGADPGALLEAVLDDVETIIDANIDLPYDPDDPLITTTDMRINSIVTDEGLLEPHGVGEVVLTVQYQKL